MGFAKVSKMLKPAMPADVNNASKQSSSSSWKSYTRSSKLFSFKRYHKNDFESQVGELFTIWKLRRLDKKVNKFVLEKTDTNVLVPPEIVEEYRTSTCAIMNPWHTYVSVDHFKPMLLHCTCCIVFEVIAVICECGVGVDFALVVNTKKKWNVGLNPELKRLCLLHREVPMFYINGVIMPDEEATTSTAQSSVDTSVPNFSGQTIEAVRERISRQVSPSLKPEGDVKFVQYFDETTLYHDRSMRVTVQDTRIQESSPVSPAAGYVTDVQTPPSMTKFLDRFHVPNLGISRVERFGDSVTSVQTPNPERAQTYRLLYSQTEEKPGTGMENDFMVPSMAMHIFSTEEMAAENESPGTTSSTDIVLHDMVDKVSMESETYIL